MSDPDLSVHGDIALFYLTATPEETEERTRALSTNTLETLVQSAERIVAEGYVTPEYFAQLDLELQAHLMALMLSATAAVTELIRRHEEMN